MDNDDPIEITLQQKLQAEKLKRIIMECEDISVVQQIACELLNLNQQKAAIARWTTKRAMKAEQEKFNNKS